MENLNNKHKKENKKVVLTYGTFDLLHIGHIKLLQRAKALGDYLVVGVSTDEFNNVKGKKSVYSFAERTDIIKSISYVDEVIPEKSWDQKAEDIRKHNVNILVMGDDWTGKFDFLSTVKEYTISFKLDASAETKAAVLPPPGEDLSPDKSSINSNIFISLNSIFTPPISKLLYKQKLFYLL